MLPARRAALLMPKWPRAESMAGGATPGKGSLSHYTCRNTSRDDRLSRLSDQRKAPLPTQTQVRARAQSSDFRITLDYRIGIDNARVDTQQRNIVVALNEHWATGHSRCASRIQQKFLRSAAHRCRCNEPREHDRRRQ